MATKSIWRFRAGDTLGGFTVGHRAKMSRNPNTAYIVGVREDAGVVRVLLDFEKAQPVDAPSGTTSTRFDLDCRNITSTRGSAATVHPNRAPGLPAVHEFGSAPTVVPKGYFLIGVFEWAPAYETWRHGGWYVQNVTHPNGGCGCVSSNYDDKKWRIVCDPRRIALNEPGDFTFPSRDAAARAELELTLQLAAPI